MEQSLYEYHLCKPCDIDEINRMSKIVFVEGHLERLDDLLVTVMPLAHIVYYKYIRSFDDREYAKEDLISDALLRLYQDMSLRWDKFIHIDSYYDYYSTILRNGMIGLVHSYHNYYSQDDIDVETYKVEDEVTDLYDEIEFKLLKESINKGIIEVAERILRCRKVNTNLLLKILKIKYVEKSDLDSLKSRVRVLGISANLFNFYVEHVEYVYRLSYNYQYALLGGRRNMIDRISATLDRFEDVTYKMLSTSYYDSIIPEIYAEFGPEIAKKFVRTFSGRTVQVPDYKDFCDDLLGGVVLTLAAGDRSNLYRVAEEYHMPYKTLARIYNKAVKYDTN